MEQKFKVGDLVRSKSNDWTKGLIGRVLGHVGGGYNAVEFEDLRKGHNCNGLLKDDSLGGWHLLDYHLELAVPSDHNPLDFASRDSKIAELTAKVSELEAELEKYKPVSITKEVVICKHPINGNRVFINNIGDTWEGYEILARKTVTITEGEGM